MRKVIQHSWYRIASSLRLSWTGRTAALLAFCIGRLAAADLAELQREVQKLRDENGQLKQRLESQSQSIETLIRRLDTMDKKVPAPPIEAPAAPKNVHMDMHMGSTAGGAQTPTLNLRWFGDVDFRVGGKFRGGNNLPHTFSLGQLDLMANSQLSENISVMSEIVFQYRENEVAATTIERLQFQYHVNDLVNVQLGRVHTPFGYWNETFHHGTWFQTTVLRPEVLRFHDGGSVLPIHSVGVEMYGYRAFDALDLHYTVGVANGRPALFSDTVNAQDLNNNKAYYGVLSVAPAVVPGLRFGVNAYVDVIPPDPAIVARRRQMDETITGAHAVYNRNNVELLAETMLIRHKDRFLSRTYSTWGAYAQAAYQFDKLKPYFRYDVLDAAPVDPYYGASVVDIKRYTFGLRWDMIGWAALKLEYHYLRQDQIESPHAVYTQATFSF